MSDQKEMIEMLLTAQVVMLARHIQSLTYTPASNFRPVGEDEFEFDQAEIMAWDDCLKAAADELRENRQDVIRHLALSGSG